MTEENSNETKERNFITNIIDADLESGKWQHIVTRFPPEPNGYLHIGHAYAACLSFRLSQRYPGSRCHLRLDDTNPEREEEVFARGIQEDIKWLGFDYGENLYYASDYFDNLLEIARSFIAKGFAYVCELTAAELLEHRGTLKTPAKPSPGRQRSPEENIKLFEEMIAGECKPGSRTLRAKIDLASGNLHMRDPVLYRIKHISHPRQGDKYKIYPSYDFTHCLSDTLERITHSLCSLEFTDHRPLYDWIVERAELGHAPNQYEFSRMNLSYTVTSKRKLRYLVENDHVDGWDDPRMPTLSGMRQRGYPPAAIRNFCSNLGVSRSESITDFSLLEEHVRDRLNAQSNRRMAVLNPLKIVISTMEPSNEQVLEVANHPQNPAAGERKIPFTREIYIDHEDFMLEPPKKYFRLSPGKEVRLRGAYVIRCDEVVYDEKGEIDYLLCSHDSETLGKNPEGRKVKGVIHWVPAKDSISLPVTLYDRLFKIPDPASEDIDSGAFEKALNPQSKSIIIGAMLEPALAEAKPDETFQFERVGYFKAASGGDNDKGSFHRVVTLKDSWR